MTMDVTFAPTVAEDAAAALVVFVGADGVLSAGARRADERSGGQVGRAMKAAGFSGESGKVLEILAPAGMAFPRLVLAGLGDVKQADELLFEKLGGRAAAKLLRHAKTLVADFGDLGGLSIPAGVAAARFANGATLRSWCEERYKTKLPDDRKAKLARVVLAGVAGEAEGAALVARLQHVARGVALTRELVTEPANVLYPETFVERVRAVAEPLGVTVTVLDEEALKRIGAGALLGVGQGSARPPRIMALEWNGASDPDAAPLALVGKGVTFDSGGISLKPGAGMWDMKWDMGGAGAVAGAIVALAGRKARLRVVGVCGLAENMPDGNAQRPGDIVTTMSGQTVEVLNTDAEGRLLLSDTLHWTQETFRPHTILDFATLTGAIIVALEHRYAGVFTNSDALWTKLDAAARKSDDLVWRQPLSPVGGYYDKLLKSPIADMKNVGPRWGGSITAAQFLQRFVRDGTEWAHLDIAGTVWRPKARALHEKGATGYGVRLVDQLVADCYEE